MAAIAAGVGVVEGAVRALAAGADALCLGPKVDGSTVRQIHAAVVEAVRVGALDEGRVEEAAARVRATAEWVSRAAPASHAGPEVGLSAARRAVVVEGEIAPMRPAVVVELEAERSMACDPPRLWLADLLGAEGIRVREGETPGLDRRARPLIVVVRDAHRHAWQRRLVGELAPEVVVETGLPCWRPDDVARYVATHGSGSVNLRAAAERLLGESAT
jgi:beta-N-acetylhexosaminidase